MRSIQLQRSELFAVEESFNRLQKRHIDFVVVEAIIKAWSSLAISE